MSSSSEVLPHDGRVIARSLVDPDAFGGIFVRHAPVIHRYLARRLGQSAADDLLAETFLVAFAKRNRFEPSRTDARPWLYGIAGNVIRQHGREEAHRLRLLARLGSAPDEAEPAEDVVQRVSAEAARARLAHGLAGLSGPDREVLILIAWEDLSYGEVATATAIPVGTVRSRLHRARRQMRRALDDRDPTSLPATLEEMLGNG